MKLGKANEELFGKFPRFVGSPRQFMVFDETSMQKFLEANWDKNNVYSRIGYVGESGDTVSDKISVDFDGPEFECPKCGDLFQKDQECSDCEVSVEPLEEDDAEAIRRMRNDKEFAEKILGGVVRDVRKISEFFIEEKIPAIGIFTGWGFHVHALYQPRVEAAEELRTTALKWEEDLGLESLDKVPVGDTKRLMRMANCGRISAEDEHCNLYTVPWTLEEMRDITMRDLLQNSFDTRSIEVPDWERPEMRIFSEYQKSKAANREIEAFEVDVSEVDDENLVDILEMLLPLPCIHERITQRDPRHPIRMNAAVCLFNRGFSVDEVHTLFRRLGWMDWDPDTTRGYLNQIYNKKYREMSCATLMERGFCVFDDEEQHTCPTYDWEGGECWY